MQKTRILKATDLSKLKNIEICTKKIISKLNLKKEVLILFDFTNSQLMFSLQSTLSSLENREFQKIKKKIRKIQYLITRHIIKKVIESLFNIHFEKIEIIRKNNGLLIFTNNKRLSNFFLSTSYSDNYAVLFLSKRFKISVDIEKIKPHKYSSFLKYFSSNEKKSIKKSQNPLIAFLKVWTLKECLHKINLGRKKNLLGTIFNSDFVIGRNEISCIIRRTKSQLMFDQITSKDYIISYCIDKTK